MTIPQRAAAVLGLAALAFIGLCPASSASAEPEPSRDAVKAAIDTIEGFENFLVLKEALADPRAVQLGHDLFFDRRISHGQVMSCSTCHQPERAYSDGLPRSRGRDGVQLQRNAVALKITALEPHYVHGLFREGRAATLEDAAIMVFTSSQEFATTPEEMAAALSADAGYARRFKEIYGPGGITMRNAANALKAFIESIPPTRPSPYDRVLDDWTAMTPAQKRGLVLFAGKARCVRCHHGPDMSGAEVFNIGENPLPGVVDEGRFVLTRDPEDRWAFKTPSLRDVAVTGPYRHDGRAATLAQVIEYYDRGGDGHAGQSSRIRPLHLTALEKLDLEAFLHSLTSPPDPGDPPFVETPLPASPPGLGTSQGSEPSSYWDLAFEIDYRLDKARDLLDMVERTSHPWTVRADYSGKRCSTLFSPERLISDEGLGHFDEREKTFLKNYAFWDLIDYYRSLAFAKNDESFCTRLGYQGSKFIPESGYYHCRNFYLEMGFARAMFTRRPDFMKVCNELGEIDADALRYKPLCPTIHQNLDNTDLMCEKLEAPFLLPLSVRTCKVLFKPINGEPIDCDHAFLNGPGYERCRSYSLFSRAYRAHDPSLCGESEGCEILMGNGAAVAARVAERLKAKLCSSDPGRAAWVRKWKSAAEVHLDKVQSLLDQTAAKATTESPVPAEAFESRERLNQLRDRLLKMKAS